MPPPHYDFLIKVSPYPDFMGSFMANIAISFSSLEIQVIEAHSDSNSLAEMRFDRCWEIMSSSAILRRRMDAFLYHDYWHRL